MGAARSSLHTGGETDSYRKRHRLGFSRTTPAAAGATAQYPPASSTTIPPSSGSGSASSSGRRRRRSASGSDQESSSPSPLRFAPPSSSDAESSVGNTTTTTPDLLRKASYRRPRSAALPGGAGGAGGGESGEESERKSVGSSAAAGGSTYSPVSTSGAVISSPLMGFSRSRPTSGGAPARPDSSGRQSFRMIRQPSTYGDLHEMVVKQKLGNGVVRGLVGEPIFRCFCSAAKPLLFVGCVRIGICMYVLIYVLETIGVYRLVQAYRPKFLQSRMSTLFLRDGP